MVGWAEFNSTDIEKTNNHVTVKGQKEVIEDGGHSFRNLISNLNLLSLMNFEIETLNKSTKKY